jgi:hypothetical protein
MRSILRSTCIPGIALFCAMTMSGGAFAGTITSGPFSVSIGPNGSLYDGNGSVAFQRLSDGYDPLIPGVPRDSWGVVTSSGSDAVDPYAGCCGHTPSSTSVYTASSATVTTAADASGANVGVVENYSFLQRNILEITTTVTNDAASATDVKFGRDVDWDVSPTEFDENSFGPAITGNVINSSYYGFEDPAGPYQYPCNSGCNKTNDLGGGIELDLGVLGAGQSATFAYLYGISQIGENVNGLIAQVDADGAYYYIATQSSENGAYPELGTNSAIIAVATPTPEPSTMVLVGLGLCAASFLRRKRARG